MKDMNKKIFSLIFIIGILICSFSIPLLVQAAPPNPITDLGCVFSGTPGNVWLSWSVPAGDPTSYDVRYSLGAINAANFNNAWQFTQTWPGAATQGLVTALSLNQTYFFAMKAINNDGPSTISNVVWCQASAQEILGNEKIPPYSSITNLEDGATILAGEDYLIQGNSSDTGGSSVQKVEISFDGGKNWQKTTAIKQVGSGFEWKYLWQNPEIGEYFLKTRAFDWLDNVEIPSLGTKVIVATQEAEEVEEEAEEEIQEEEQEIEETKEPTSSEAERRNLLLQIIQILLTILSRS